MESISTEAEAIAAWNTRAALPAVTAPQGVDAGDKDAPRHLVEYTNWRGETARRVIVPIRFWWGHTEWHLHDQWMLHAWDVEKEAYRDFAWQDMRPVPNPATSSAALAPAQPALTSTPVDDSQAADPAVKLESIGTGLYEVHTAQPAPDVVGLPADVRQWPFYPIQMPFNADGKGPATIGVDAADIAYEVWDIEFNTHASFNNLPDAINEAMRLSIAAAIRAKGGEA